MDSEKKVTIVTADYPDIPSGIGDYSYRLKESLEKLGFTVYVITSKDKRITDSNEVLKVRWNIGSIFKIKRFCKYFGVKALILQYPTPLFGIYNLIPIIYPLIFRLFGFNFFTTLHEFSNIHPIRRVFELALVLFSKKVIVTVEEERAKIIKVLFPLDLKNKITTINIGSNVEAVNKKPNIASNIITFFGLFYPKKIDRRVVDIMHEIDRSFKGRFIFRFVGGVSPFHTAFFKKIKKDATAKLAKTEWFIDNPFKELPYLLKDSFCAVVVYNDGASLRRGSLLAFIANGIPIITNKGQYSKDLETLENNGIFYVEDTKDATKIVSKFIEDPTFYSNCYKKLISFSKKFSFDEIARKYVSVINI